MLGFIQKTTRVHLDPTRALRFRAIPNHLISKNEGIPRNLSKKGLKLSRSEPINRGTEIIPKSHGLLVHTRTKRKISPRRAARNLRELALDGSRRSLAGRHSNKVCCVLYQIQEHLNTIKQTPNHDARPTAQGGRASSPRARLIRMFLLNPGSSKCRWTSGSWPAMECQSTRNGWK